MVGFSINYLDLLKMIFYFLHGKSTSWVIYREYFLFFGGSLSKSMIMFSRACSYVYFQFEHNGNFPTVKGLATTWLALFSNIKISNTFILDIQGIHFPSTYYFKISQEQVDTFDFDILPFDTFDTSST